MQSTHHNSKMALSKTEVIPLSSFSLQGTMSVLAVAPELLHWWEYRPIIDVRSMNGETGPEKSHKEASRQKVPLIWSVKSPGIGSQLVK